MPRPKGKDLARAADEAAIAKALHFTVVRFIGRTGRETGPVRREDLYDRRDFFAADHGGTPEGVLAAARAAKVAAGRDEYGRGSMIYAVTESGMTVFVE